MKDTKQRIAEYKEKLPKVKEKFIAMIALLIVSASMLTTVSFAWVLLSTSPEATGITTAVAANGNLEIALANGTMGAPGATLLGDGDKDLIDRNITWGNLVNLSDPSYGLSNMVLRPALLNRYDLVNSPLRAAVYSADGRFDALSTDFAFAKWQNYSDREGGEFSLTDEYGLRAIMSTKYSTDQSGFNYYQPIKYGEVVDANRKTTDVYNSIVGNSGYMNTLAVLMAAYMDAMLVANGSSLSFLLDGNKTISVKDMENLRDIFRDFSKALALEQEYYLAMANYQIFLKQYTEQTPTTATITMSDLLASISAADSIKDDKIQTNKVDRKSVEIVVELHGLSSNIDDKALIDEHLVTLETLCQTGGTHKWSEIEHIVNELVTIYSCTLDGTPIGSIGGSAATKYLDGKAHKAVITNGVLKNYEQRTGAKMNVEGLKVTLAGQSIIADITTNADHDNSSYAKDLVKAEAMLDSTREEFKLQEPQKMPNETYGFAIDFWVRTNALDSFLILEGNVLTETRYEDAKGRDADGNEVQLYTVAEKTGESVGGADITFARDVYYKEVRANLVYNAGELVDFTEAVDGTHVIQVWYYHEDHSPYSYFRVREATQTDPTVGIWYEAKTGANDTVTYDKVSTTVTEPTWKQNEVEYVIGYEGENRVWDENSSSLISINSTTQGSGSCFVFYAHTPEDQDRGLELLSSLKIAFVSDGNVLTQAYLDTERFYSDSGKIIVPLALDKDSISIKDNNEDRLAITPLNKNEAMLISAIVYLDGTKITNDQVLATSDIQGQFNIQFGNAWDQNAASNDKLESEELTIGASISKSEFDYDSGEALTTRVTANISGINPQKVQAFFVRTITSTQGVPLSNVVNFTNNGDGTWSADYTFPGPGEFVLRSLRIDGVEYDLPKDNRPTVSISGFAITGISWDVGGSSYRWLTSASSVSTGVQLNMAMAVEDNKIPQIVGMFHGDGQTVSVNFAYDRDAQTWKGTANFATSGIYVLDMLVIDGAYFPIDTQHQKTAEVISGMKVAVYTTSPQYIVIRSDTNLEDANLAVQVEIMDNTGKELVGLSGVTLYYGRKGYISDEVGMDADLKWNATAGYYEGTMEAKPGEYEFLRVSVASNEITSATTAPTFRVISPEAYPEFEAGRTPLSQYAPNGGVLDVQLKNADGAKVAAVVQQYVNGNWVAYKTIESHSNASGVYAFAVPDAGTYRIQKLLLQDVFDDEQNYIPAASVWSEVNSYVIDWEEAGADTEGYLPGTQTTIVKEIQAELTGAVNLGGTSLADAVAEFMASQSLTDAGRYGEELKLTLTAGGVPFVGATNVKLTYLYDFKPQEYGGYSASSQQTFEQKFIEDNGSKTVTITLTDPDGDGIYTVDSNATLIYAGKYTFAGGSYVLAEYDDKVVPLNADDFTSTISVYSKKPTIKFTAVNPAATTVNANDEQVAAVNKISSDQFTVNAYIKGTKEWAFVYYWNYEVPTVTMQMQDSSTFESATFTLVNPAGADYNNVVKFEAPNTDVDSNVGYRTGGTGEDTKYPLGSQTISQISVVKNGITFTALLSNAITFNQPDVIKYVAFQVTDESYNGFAPEGIASGDGNTIVAVMPELSWLTAKEGGSVTVTKTTPGTAERYYTVRTESDGCGGNNTYYTLYEVTPTTYEGNGEATKHQVAYWQDSSGNKYYPGNQYTFADTLTLTAVIETVDTEGTVEMVGSGREVNKGSNNLTSKPANATEVADTDDRIKEQNIVWEEKKD